MLSIHPEAHAYAEVHTLALPDLPVRSQPWAEDSLQLVRDEGLAVRLLSQPKMKPLRIDFVSGKLDHRRRFGGGRQQDLARACGLHETTNLTILDATAGLGRDAFVLASLGASVLLVERHPVLQALLQDGLQRAAEAAGEDDAISQILQRMQIRQVDALTLQPEPAPDVIYLDPMFPPREKSASVKADMQIMHALMAEQQSGPDQAAGLLDWALNQARHRVVVKRPRTAPPLAGQSPSHRLTGKSNRFDVYTLKRLPV
ncbi:MAG: class I SAM-dependent methyltransferase [Natronospirillum sp.]|uniref:class I SAM-dependent methyltransferase n=1 Tax=Natronospirillum sp. TaxID=2812955 RepID=UPI0025E42A1F|nr:class I SAM-dependent methyltransferase [Natronospirillum sp.]MCH8551434.1 class I SAM-dependent methyltransferase [Natronospirillum sp.]